MGSPGDSKDLAWKWLRRAAGLIRGRADAPTPVDNPIRTWGGVLDRSAGVATELAALRERLESAVPHERDFGFFASLEGNTGLFVDIGANAGQSAVSLRCVNQSLRIMSFEPNPLLEPILQGLRDGLLGDFDYRIVGLSDHRGTRILYVPVIDDLLVTPLATLDNTLFERPHFHEQLEALSLTGTYEIEEITVALEPLDDLQLRPTVVKIDTEEHEMACLRGMVATLERCTPVLMIEHDPHAEEVAAFLADLGYRRLVYDSGIGALVRPTLPIDAINVFYVHPEGDPRT